MAFRVLSYQIVVFYGFEWAIFVQLDHPLFTLFSHDQLNA